MQKTIEDADTPEVPGVPETLESAEAPAVSRGALGATEVPLEEGRMPSIRAESSVRQRFQGRANQRTFAKEVRFIFDDRFVVSGGDCGNVYIWRTSDGALLQRFRADGSICNCVSPHPTLPLLAASGIDDTIKIFEVGGMDRPPLVRRPPPISRGHLLLNAVGAATSMKGGHGPSPCRSLGATLT